MLHSPRYNCIHRTVSEREGPQPIHGENCGMRIPRSTLGNVNGIRLVVMMCAMVSPLFCQDAGQPESKAIPAPKLAFLDWKACPFEGCAYREWTARKAIAVYDTWEQKRRPVARLSPRGHRHGRNRRGDHVQARRHSYGS